MSVVHDIIQALWQQDFSALADPHVIWVVYGILFTTLFLENGLLPASFLPGDSLLLLTGAMIAKGVMSFFPTMILLTIAASLGCWLSYLQGRWLSDTRLVKGWLLQLPAHYHQRAHHLFHRHGLMALLVGRFLAFIRTLLPTMAGISGLNNTRFQIFNWLSGLLWVGGIVTLGYALSHIPLVKRYEDQVMTALILLPIILLISGLIGMAVVVWRKKRAVA
ncbi:DedA family protein [Pectobacterium aroidearum]|jgi:membrane protein DedA with SNARE-associated domain|uniref:Inner membrane protein YghB n=2 Tax=Pectobacterium TaxID=122277 RepID=A0AAW3T064_9GAMM|nr:MULTISPECIES: DedA family protein [Pectobacterium]ACT11399.1 SNARE associated Golgi protein [Pectobacterium carotovorum subsp. carotovorum PC1]MBA0205363.1 DedA family protein [Pectobacterium aroidearum]MBA5200645.1 DedA family protein [Pectobacterium aroidearum]MBA5205445.1 DedA family protein [Pectobacterium aroidearum]MBA5229027.1 DedA family protein [Pectobacterium aroidearum]